MSTITKKLENHYTQKFLEYGATPQGVDWGNNGAKTKDRYDAFLNIIPSSKNVSLLDIGCGYGHFLEALTKRGCKVDYTGIDCSKPMIDWAQKNFNSNAVFLNTDFDSYFASTPKQHDYIVCLGIFTQKLDASNLDMTDFMKDMITKMFSLSKVGVAFNLMSSYSNFYSNNLYYKSPLELLPWILENISKKITLNHYYVDYEYLIYIAK